jgi:hypothetical protein
LLPQPVPDSITIDDDNDESIPPILPRIDSLDDDSDDDDSMPSLTIGQDSSSDDDSDADDSHTKTASAPTQRRAMPSILMHRRLGPRTINTLIIGSKNEVWADTKLRLESDSFCDSCQIVTARSNNRGKSPLDIGTEDMKPGESIMVDLVPNLNKHGLTTSSHYKYWIIFTDVKTRFLVPIGTNHKNPEYIAKCLVTWYADETYFCDKFLEVLHEHRISGSFAAPRHQEQNGICVRAWQSIREIAFKMMVFAQVGDEFYDFAIEQAWKIFNVLPLRDLVDDNGKRTPFEAFTGVKPKLCRFRVLFCDCVINNGTTKRPRDPNNPSATRKIDTRTATPARFPLLHSLNWRTARQSRRLVRSDDDDVQRFANPTVDELFDQVKEESPDSTTVIDSDDSSTSIDELPIAPVITDPLFNNPIVSFNPDSEESSDESSASLDDEPTLPSDDTLPSHDAHGRSRRDRVPTDRYKPVDSFDSSRVGLIRHAAHQAQAFAAEQRNHNINSYMRSAFQAEVTNPDSVAGQPADPFQPEPTHWRHIMSMPEHIKRYWIASMRQELKTLFKMGTFSKDVTVSPSDDTIPVTAKFRCKLQSNGTIEKLKARICLRGDLQTRNELDTWCAIAGFRALKVFLAVAARTMCRIYQLDFVGAFLQSYAIDRTITELPSEWKELFPEYAEWFGIPLLCVKSIYGGSHANHSFDTGVGRLFLGSGAGVER